MKATLAFVACLLTAGFLSAAEVTGNNTAVVIRKNTVESDTGFQFLCVPVDGLDIANGTQKTVKLSTVLPANTVPNGTQVIFVGGTITGSRIVENGAWSAEADLNGGQIFWLKYPNSRSGASVKPDTVIFCGQDRARDELTSLGSGVTALKNDSSKEITLDQAVNMENFTPGTNDQILTIKAGTAEYKIYTYDEGWYGEGFGQDAIDDAAAARIAPGEAFYYFRAN